MLFFSLTHQVPGRRRAAGPRDEGVCVSLHVVCPQVCQRGVWSVPGQREEIQLHHAQVLPGADRPLPEPAGQEEQRAAGMTFGSVPMFGSVPLFGSLIVVLEGAMYRG